MFWRADWRARDENDANDLKRTALMRASAKRDFFQVETANGASALTGMMTVDDALTRKDTRW
jgi:hypothetical protein